MKKLNLKCAFDEKRICKPDCSAFGEDTSYQARCLRGKFRIEQYGYYGDCFPKKEDT